MVCIEFSRNERIARACSQTCHPPRTSIVALSSVRQFIGFVLFTGAVDALLALGWVHDEASPEELVVREGVYFSMKGGAQAAP